MSNISDEKYEFFKSNLNAVNGSCERSTKAELGKKLVDLFSAQGLKDCCVNDTDFLKELGVVDALKAAGITVYTDHIRLHGETAKGGISEMHGGIAELGTMMQFSEAINGRLVAIMAEDFFGILPASRSLTHTTRCSTRSMLWEKISPVMLDSSQDPAVPPISNALVL